MATLARADDPYMAPGEWELRVDLAAAYRLVAMYGWDDMVFTHLSVRVPGPEHHFLINPYGLMFDEITASSLVKIDMEGKPVAPTPYKVNRAGFVIHSALHMGREDARAVMHLHTPHGMAVSAMEFGLRAYTQTSMLVTHDLAYHDYEGSARNLDERERLIADMGDKNAMILRNHGTLAVGPDIESCFMRLYFLERACHAQVLMLSAGRENLTSPFQGVEELMATRSGNEQMMRLGNLAWPALLRKLDRMDPGFRD